MSNVLTGPISGQLLQSGWVLCLVGVREGEDSGPIDPGGFAAESYSWE